MPCLAVRGQCDFAAVREQQRGSFFCRLSACVCLFVCGRRCSTLGLSLSASRVCVSVCVLGDSKPAGRTGRRTRGKRRRPFERETVPRETSEALVVVVVVLLFAMVVVAPRLWVWSVLLVVLLLACSPCGVCWSYNKECRARINPQTSTTCLLYTSPSPRDQRGSRMPSSA